MTKDEKLAAQIKRDYRQAHLDAKTRALLDFAVEVTRDVHRVNPSTLARLRAAGWSDEEILTATHIIGFFNYYTRLADALGVDPEDFMKRD
ncbi:MAG: carboxymuconolactone decarboxylase family protein [Terriglobia bacterium]